MLLEFRCSNHSSIKEEVKFSMVAGSDNTSEELLKKLEILEFCVLQLYMEQMDLEKVILLVPCPLCVI